MTPTEAIIQAGQQYKENQITFEQYGAVLAKYTKQSDFATMTDEEAIQYCLKQPFPEEFLHNELMNLLPGVPAEGEEWIDTERYERLQELFEQATA